MPEAHIEALRNRIGRFEFRELHPRLAFGTASDRYAGWIGQIYSEDRWGKKVSKRARKLGGETFEERQVPVASVEEYFKHFGVLELDFTFYRPLLEDDGRAGTNFFVLQQYADAAPEDARFVLKAPQAYTARILRRGSGYVANPTYLDARGFQDQFAEPATGLLGERLRGVIFEQEYNRVSESPDPATFSAQLETFFAELPSAPQMHLEIRSPHLLDEPFFEMLRRRGLGFCFSHWTYLPPLKQQWERAGGEAERTFTAADGQVVLRLLTPLKVPYAKAYAMAYPFDASKPEITDTPGARRMLDESAALVVHALEGGRQMNVIVNNRAWGNAPELARSVAERVLDHLPGDDGP